MPMFEDQCQHAEMHAYGGMRLKGLGCSTRGKTDHVYKVSGLCRGVYPIRYSTEVIVLLSDKLPSFLIEWEKATAW